MELTMKFQPGQSGNPAGRPPGSRNKKTLAMEEELAERAHEAVDRIVLFAKGGNATAMRICAEWVRPTGTNRPLELGLPEVQCSDDARVALNIVLAAFARGEITVRQFPVVLGGLERAVRIAERIQQMAEREQKGRQIRGETHPSLLPHPVPDPMEPIFAAIDRGEDPFPEDSAEATAESLYSPVNSDDPKLGDTEAPPTPDPSPPPVGRGEGNPEAAVDATKAEALYSPVISSEEPPPAADAGMGSHRSLGSPPPASEASGGEGSGVGGVSVQRTPFEQINEEPAPGAADAAPSYPASGGIEGDGLYFPVNSENADGAGAPGTAPGGTSPAREPAAGPPLGHAA
jgi:uncharacterized protein DUF5681